MSDLVSRWLSGEVEESEWRVVNSCLFRNSTLAGVRYIADGRTICLTRPSEADAVLEASKGIAMGLFTLTADGLRNVALYMENRSLVRTDGLEIVDRTNLANAALTAQAALIRARAVLPRRLAEIERLPEAWQCAPFVTLVAHRDDFGCEGFNHILSMPEDAEHDFVGSLISVGWWTPEGGKRQPVYLGNSDVDAVEARLKGAEHYQFAK